MKNIRKRLHPHHTLRNALIKDILIWAGCFFSILVIIFFTTLSSLVDYMLAEMAENKMNYQAVEFAKHLDQHDPKSIRDESDALIQDDAVTGMIVVDSAGVIAHMSFQGNEAPLLNISPDMSVSEMRNIVNSDSHLRLFEKDIPRHAYTLAIIMDRRPVLRGIYVSTLWTGLLLFFLAVISILALHYSLRRHLIKPIDEMKHLIDDDLLTEEKQDIIDHLPDEVAALASSYEDTYRSHELMEQQFIQAQKMEAIGTLVGGIAHDFNNMLAGITGNLYLAKTKIQGNPEALQKLINIENLSFRAGDMIQQLLTFARKSVVEMKDIPLGSFIKEASKLIITSLPENIAIKSDICSDKLFIKGDTTQLHQVMMNLINNASDAVKDVDDPQITIKLERFEASDDFIKIHTYFNTETYARLSVEDNGYGIPETQMEHLFEPFFTTKPLGEGTGLGLAMVYGAIKTHHGYIEVESVEGKGSTFHIYLPLLREAIVNPDSQEEGDIFHGNNEIILLVDDDESVLDVGEEVLESLGYRVLKASDGLQAIDVFTAHQNDISLIIIDIVMPRLNGVKSIERIRKIRPEIKTIFATGYDKESTLQNKTPSTEFITLSKPYNIRELSEAIRQQLEA